MLGQPVTVQHDFIYHSGVKKFARFHAIVFQSLGCT
jgi:hypothetical protein